MVAWSETLEISFANWIGRVDFIRKPISSAADFSTGDSLTDQFRLNPDRNVSVENYFGSPLVIVDGLYANPEAVRNAALGLNYVLGRDQDYQ